MAQYTNTGIVDVDTVLAQNAFVIGQNIFESHLYMEPWFNVLPKSKAPEGVGHSLVSMIYDKSIPTVSAGGAVGVNFQRLGTDVASANSLNSSIATQPLTGAANETLGATSDGSGAGANAMAYVTWTKKLRDYYLEIARVRSPYVDVHDLRTAANRAAQVTAITNALGDSTKWVWARRNQTEYERVCGNLVPCLTASTPILDTVDTDTDSTADDPFYGANITDLDPVTSGAGNSDVTPTATISNAIMDKIHTRLRIQCPPSDAYAMDGMGMVFGLMLSSDASRSLLTESGYRDDVRESSKVDDLIKPLGINNSFRGFMHITNDTMPRFTISGSTVTRVEPLTATGAINSAYDTADYEAAYVLVKSVMEVQIPDSNVSAPGFSFDPVRYTGEFAWVNNKNDTTNPLGTIGFFLGTIATASMPKQVERGYVILFKRTSTSRAA